MPQQVSRHCWLRSRIVVENEAAKERGISSRTLKRAKAKLGVESEKTEDGGCGTGPNRNRLTRPACQHDPAWRKHR
jgi:hypothetical protein